MEDMIVRFDGHGEIDRYRTHVIKPDNTYDNCKLNLDKLKELIEANDPKLYWLEETIKYALKYHDVIRNQGASEVVLFTCQDYFEELIIEKPKANKHRIEMDLLGIQQEVDNGR